MKRIVICLMFSLGLIGLWIGLNIPQTMAAEEYPNKPLTYTIFWPPGGRSDIVARMISPYLEKYLGTPVVVNNNVGGAGVPYNSPFKSLKELVDFGKANPKKLKHGNSGTGSTTHLGSAAFGMKFGCEFTQIAYKGEGPAVIGIASGEIDLSFGPMAAFKQMVEAGKLRILANCAPKRSKQHSQIATTRELGFDFAWDAWEAIFGPKGLPENKTVYPKLSEAVKKAILDPELDQKLLAIGLDVQYKPTDELEKWLKEDDKEIKKITFDLGLQNK